MSYDEYQKSTYQHLTKNNPNKVHLYITNPSAVKDWQRIAYEITLTKDSSISDNSALKKFTAKQFEHFCAYILMISEGWEIQYADIDNEHHLDGGVDIVLKRGTEMLFVQCKKHDSPTLKLIESKTGKKYRIAEVQHVQRFIDQMGYKPIKLAFPDVQNLRAMKKKFLYITLGFFDKDVVQAFPQHLNVRKWQLHTLKNLDVVKQLASVYIQQKDVIAANLQHQITTETNTQKQYRNNATLELAKNYQENYGVKENKMKEALAFLSTNLILNFLGILTFLLIQFFLQPFTNVIHSLLLVCLSATLGYGVLKKHKVILYLTATLLLSQIIFLSILLIR